MLRDIEEELLKEVDNSFPNQERGMAEAITIVGIALDKFEALFNSNLKEQREVNDSLLWAEIAKELSKRKVKFSIGDAYACLVTIKEFREATNTLEVKEG